MKLESLEERLERKERISQGTTALGHVDVPADIRAKMQQPAREYIAIAAGYGAGALKFEYHRKLCDVIYDHLFPGDTEFESRSIVIHDATLDVVDFLDETIDLPLRKLTEREEIMYSNRLINRLWSNLELYKSAAEKERI